MSVFAVIAFALILGYGAFHYGAVLAEDWALCLAAIGLLSAVYWAVAPRDQPLPKNRLVTFLVVLLPTIALLQLLPLPAALIERLSPAAAAIHLEADSATLSLAPAATFQHLLKLGGCLLALLLARSLCWRLEGHLWAVAIPVVVVAGLEALLGLVQSVGLPGNIARGTYVNRNHFAGLLEMALPFPVMYGVAAYRRGLGKYETQASPSLLACSSLALATVMLLGVLLSLSRMGFLACLASLFVMGVLALGGRRWIPSVIIALLVIAGFVLLPTDQLIARFADIASTEDISGDTRLQLWRESLRLVREYPLFGVGLGGYESAFLQYKSVAPLNRADYAHNDYVQGLAELGFLGFLPALTLGVLALVSATRTSSRARHPGADYLAVACAGSLTALLLHSVVDFNLHIPANALAAAWICGIALSAGRPVQARSLPMAVIGLTLMIAALGVFMPDRFSPVLCETILCTDATLERRAAAHSASGNLDEALRLRKVLLRRDPASPYRWCDLGDAQIESGDASEARLSFQRASILGSEIPPILMRIANFHFRTEDHGSALKYTAKILLLIRDYDGVIFSYYDRMGISVADILARGVPAERAAAQSLLRYLMTSRTVPEVGEAWTWLTAHSFADDRLAGEYIDYLVRRREYRRAAEMWAQYLGDRSGEYLRSNHLFDGDFQAERTGALFDWRISAADGVQVSHENGCLRLQFAGIANVVYNQIAQTAWVSPGPLRFRARIRTEGLTTDEGVGFRIFDPEAPSRLDIFTEKFIGTHRWTTVEKHFTIPSATNLLTVQLVRQASRKFDNKIAGSVWIDQISLVR